MAKKVVRLTESQLHRVIAESVKKILKEGYEDLLPNEQRKLDELQEIYYHEKNGDIRRRLTFSEFVQEECPSLYRTWTGKKADPTHVANGELSRQGAIESGMPNTFGNRVQSFKTGEGMRNRDREMLGGNRL